MEYTKKQRQAIDNRDRTLLVSAAAGSGKTAVLTKRIIDSLLDTDHPTDISKLLIVTFTNASAEDMRAKITKALGNALRENPNNKHLVKQMMMLGSAHISTIDSFFFDLLHEHFNEAGFSPSVRIATKDDLFAEKRSIMNATIDEMYRTVPHFFEVADVFCDFRDEAKLTTALIELYNKLSVFPRFLEMLSDMRDSLTGHARTPLEAPVGKVFLSNCKKYTEYGKRICEEFEDTVSTEENEAAIHRTYQAPIDDLILRIKRIEDAMEQPDFGKICHELALLPEKLIARRVSKASDDFKRYQELLLQFYQDFYKFAQKYAYFSAEETERSAHRTAKIVDTLYIALSEYHKRLNEMKTMRELVEFSDVTQAVYHLLLDENGKETPLALSIKESFDAVYIDEYQDVNAIQDAIFKAISKEKNRFMVGDIKQSIYRFRGAQPDVFTKYRKSFPIFSEGAEDAQNSIFMSECFRCDQPIIDFANTVFRFLFSHHADRIGYTADDDLNFAKGVDGRAADYVAKKCNVFCVFSDKKTKKSTKADAVAAAEQIGTVTGTAGASAETAVAEKASEKDENKKTAITDEDRIILAEIKRLMGEKKADGTPICPSDIAILVHRKDHANGITALLQTEGIPVYNSFEKDLFENPEILCIYSLLAVIDNPLRDVYLAATLRSPFFDFSLSDLVRIRAAAERSLSLYEAVAAFAAQQSESGERLIRLQEKCRYFLERLNRWRDLAESLPVDRLLHDLFAETSVLAFTGSDSEQDKLSKRANMEKLYEYARKFEANGFQGLYRFVHYIDEIIKQGVTVKDEKAASDAICISTIHSSKGLEFPVCFLIHTGSTFQKNGPSERLSFDEQLGIATLLPDAGPISRCETFWHMCIRDHKKELDKEEYIRVLYVALTRARERLYVTGTPTKGESKLATEIEKAAHPSAGYIATSGISFLEWILAALETGGCGDHTELRYFHGFDGTWEKAPERKREAPSPQDFERLTDILNERFSYRYPHEARTKIPAKLSVSKLSPKILDIFDEERTRAQAPHESTEEKWEKENLLHTFERSFFKDDAKTDFTAAERGTATHEFLQFCNFEKTKKSGVLAELDRLISEGFLPEKTRTAVQTDELSAFFESDLFKTIEAARKVYRETRFNIFLPAKDFTTHEEFKRSLGEEKLLIQGVIDLFFIDKDGKTVLCDYKTDRLSKEQLRDPQAAAAYLFAAHRAQLSYYARAIKELTGHAPDKVYLYSLHAGRAFEDPLEAKG